MITFKEYLKESVNYEKLAKEFMTEYSDDPRGAYMSAKESYLDAVSNLKSGYFYAADLNQQHKTMSSEDFEKSVIAHFFPYLKKHGYPKFASKGWGDAEHDMKTEMMRQK